MTDTTENAVISMQVGEIQKELRALSLELAKVATTQTHMMEDSKQERHDNRDKINEIMLATKAHDMKDEERFNGLDRLLEQRITEVNTVLYGDGSAMGIITRQAQQEEFSGFVKRFLVAIASGVGLTFITLLFAVIKDYLGRAGVP